MEYHVEYVQYDFPGYVSTRQGADVVERICNDWAEKGYRLHSIVHKISPGVAPGYYLIFEKEEK